MRNVWNIKEKYGFDNLCQEGLVGKQAVVPQLPLFKFVKTIVFLLGFHTVRITTIRFP